MGESSPLFVSAMELYSHSVELYAQKRPRNLRFVVLHLANAVELLVKDALLDAGESIYRGPKETVSIWGAFDLCSKLDIDIPRKPQLELLIDDRNTIQHRFGFPDDRSTFYYLDEVGRFVREFLKSRLGLEFDTVIADYLDMELLPLVGVSPSGFKAKIQALFKISPATAVVEAYEHWNRGFLTLVNWDRTDAVRGGQRRFLDESQMVQALISHGFYPDDAQEKINALRRSRGQAAHGAEQNPSWSKALKGYSELIDGHYLADKAGYLYPEADSPEPQEDQEAG